MQIELSGYKIISTLGKGGMATVYLAIQESFQREVALKVMNPELLEDPSFGERFLREAQIVSRLVHPNIVTVYDVGIHNGYYFLSMEYVPGQDLIHKHKTLSLADNLRVVKEIARALDFAGKKGYVHRDVKPENIMLHDEDGRAVLMDFGIARPSDTNSGMTKTGTAIGTPHYMSPEQAKGLAIDSRADLYSLGVVLFLVITGHVPYDSDSAVVVGIMHISEDIPCLPLGLQVFQPIIDKALAKNPAQRYQTGAELIAALDAVSAEDLATAVSARERGEHVVKKFEKVQKTAAQPQSTPVAATVIVPSAIVPSAIVPSNSFPSVNEENDSQKRMVARSEDRNYEPEVKSGGNGLWIGLGLVAAIAGGGYYFQNDLKQQYHHYVDGKVASNTTSESVASTSVAAPASQQSFIDHVKALRENLKQDWTVAPELSALYRSGISSNNPIDRQVSQNGLSELQIFYADQIKTALQDNALDLARKYAESAQTVFDEAERMPTLSDALSSVKKANATGEQLKLAENYLAKDALVGPAGANALEIYRSVLEENSTNSVALQGIEKIALRFGELAVIQQKNNNIDQALELVKKGLELSSNNSILLDQQQSLNQLKQKQRTQKAIVASAQPVTKPVAQSNVAVSVAISSAVAQKTRRDTAPTVAQNEAAAAENNFIQQINQLVSEEKYSEASALLVTARESFPQSKALLSLALEVEHAAADNAPTVARLQVTGEEANALTQQEPSIAAERVIYIGFEYRNFKAETSVIQAILYDGSRSLQIAQVPVVIHGTQGIKFFRIEQPVSGFANGGYNIDLLIDQKPLISTRFSVKK